MILEKINQINDLKKLSLNELNLLAHEIKEAILFRCSKIGGHLGSNLGVIELTIALHYVFNEEDKIIFDVSHQVYAHKILTGRKNAFLKEENFKDVNGFFNPHESEFDLFRLGHTSSSISLGNGIRVARDLKNEKYHVISIIGDGALSGGEAFEGLNNVTEFDSPFIIIINDNMMSIAENHGAIYQNLKELRENNGEIHNNFFKTLGLDYLYLENGNDIESLINTLNIIKNNQKPIVLHIKTTKGNGYQKAILDKENYHYTPPFDLKKGMEINASKYSYSELTYEFLSSKMIDDKKVVVVTSAVPTLAGFSKERREIFKNQFFDTGISEAHATSFLAGLSKNGLKAYYPLTINFFQRAYDQLILDLCLNKINTTLIICVASLFSKKDPTHLGVFDETMLINTPNLVYLDPTSKEEYLRMLEYSYLSNNHGVLAIRMPYNLYLDNEIDLTDYSILNKSKVIQKGTKVALFYVGNLEYLAKEVSEYYLNNNLTITLIRQRFLSGIDEILLNSLLKDHELIITLEDSYINGGFGEKISSYLGKENIKVINLGLKKEFIEHFEINKVLEDSLLTKEKIIELINKNI